MYSSSKPVSLLSIYPQEERLYKPVSPKNQTIGVPKEQYCDEKRVAITPNGVEALVLDGYDVIVERGAGAAASFPDSEYIECGASMVSSHEDIFSKSNLVFTVNHPDVDEINLMQKGAVLVSSTTSGHINTDTLTALMNQKITAISRELIGSQKNNSPIINALLPIEGKAAVLMAAELLSNAKGGRGILLGGVAGVKPVEMVIIGAGTVSEHAVKVAVALGVSIKVFGQSIEALSIMKHNLGEPLYTSLLYPRELAAAMKTADVVICTLDVRWNYYASPFRFEEDLFQGMQKGAVVIDMVMDYDHHFGEMRQDKPNQYLYEKYGILYYGVSNLSSRVAHTASFALNDILTPIVMKLYEGPNVPVTLHNNVCLRTGVYAYKGVVTKEFLKDQYGVKYQDIEMLLIRF